MLQKVPPICQNGQSVGIGVAAFRYCFFYQTVYFGDAHGKVGQACTRIEIKQPCHRTDRTEHISVWKDRSENSTVSYSLEVSLYRTMTCVGLERASPGSVVIVGSYDAAKIRKADNGSGQGSFCPPFQKLKAIKGVGSVSKRVDERDLRTGICNVHGSNGLLTIERNTDLIKGLRTVLFAVCHRIKNA